MLKPPRQSLEQEAYLCYKIGLDIEVLDNAVVCDFIKDSSECKKGGMCEVYMAMSRTRHRESVQKVSTQSLSAQSQPKFIPDELDRLGCPPISQGSFTHPNIRDNGYVHPDKKY